MPLRPTSRSRRDSNLAQAPLLAASSDIVQTVTVPRLRRPVLACSVLERTKAIQIRDAARVVSQCDYRYEDNAGDESRRKESGDVSESEQSTSSSVEQRVTGHSAGQQAGCAFGSRSDVEHPVAEGDLDLFLKVASDWHALDPNLLTFEYRRPRPLSQADSLEAAVETVSSMFNCHHAVANFMMREVGDLLAEWVSQRPNILSELAKTAAEMKVEMYFRLLADCGCDICQTLLTWEQERLKIEGTGVPAAVASYYGEDDRPGCCPDNQVRLDNFSTRFSGMSSNNLRRAVKFSRTVVSGEGPAVVSAPQSRVTDSCLTYLERAMSTCPRRLATELPSYTQFEHIRPPGCLVQIEKSQLQCFDGDGVEVPLRLLSDLADRNGLHLPPTLDTYRRGDQHLVRCRFAFVDSPEIADVYSVMELTDWQWKTVYTIDVCLLCLRYLRHFIHVAGKLFISLPLNCSLSQLNSYPVAAHGRAALDLWWTYETQGRQTLASISITLLLNGLAFLDERYHPPTVAYTPEEDARRRRRRLFQLPAAATTSGSLIMPWKRRVDTQDPEETVREQQIDETTVVKVQQCHTYTAERFLFVATSSAPGGNDGLFLCPRQYAILKDRYICVYTEVIVPSDDAESLQEDRDYLVTVESGGRKTTYDGELFDSVLCNYGRFANDLGLQQTIDYAVQQAGLATYSYFAKRDVEVRSKNTANCVFRVERTGTGGKRRLILAAAKEIPPGGVLELSVRYGFFTYWTVHVAVARTPNRLPSAISDPVLWLLLSSHSALNDDERRQFTNDLWDPEHGLTTLPDGVQQRYREAVVPTGLRTRDFAVIR